MRKSITSDRAEEKRLPWMGRLLVKCYAVNSRTIRRIVIRFVGAVDGGFWSGGAEREMYSRTLRVIFKKYHGVDVGLYSSGGMFDAGRFPPGTRIGRYTAIAEGARLVRNHPLNLKSIHHLFFRPELGHVDKYLGPQSELDIGNDVWIGTNAILLGSVKKIGDGAVIGAGAVVGKDVPPFAVVVGCPARIVRYRFSKEKIGELIEEQWWQHSIEELKPRIEEFTTPIDAEHVRH